MSYDQKQQKRKTHYLELSKKAAEKSNDYYEQSLEITKGLPFGQPILVGHHSETRHRRLLERSHAYMRRAREESKKANDYADKAERVGSGGISSDDENAIEKLNEKVNKLKMLQEVMKLTNKQYKKGGWSAVTAISPCTISQLKKNVRDDEKPFPTFELTNNNIKIKATEKRIRLLEKMQEMEPFEEIHANYTYFLKDNRVQFFFNNKPSEDIRRLLKKHAFRWSKSLGVWMRKLSPNALSVGRRIKERLNLLFYQERDGL